MSLRSYVLLCREGIPAALEDLYEAADVGTIHEAAWVVIHFLMLETGYICVASEVIILIEKLTNEKHLQVYCYHKIPVIRPLAYKPTQL